MAAYSPTDEGERPKTTEETPAPDTGNGSAPALSTGTPSNATIIDPAKAPFSGFIFKIQANMDPRHRDRIAFVRICSGTFTREMPVIIPRTGKRIKLNSTHKLFGRERETVDTAYPGDIVGIVGHSDLAIGDTLFAADSDWTKAGATGPTFHELPRFAPEVFAYIHSDNTSQFKSFRAGLDQLLQEGVVQVLKVVGSLSPVPLLGAVGALQFEVVQYRLKAEYGADSRLKGADWTQLRWLDPKMPRAEAEALVLPTGAKLAEDQVGRLALLFESEWSMNYFLGKNPTLTLASEAA